MAYNYRQGKLDIIDILTSKTKVEETNEIPLSDSNFTYENGIRAWTSSIFVDIVGSSSIFKGDNDEHVSRIMRAFVSQLITILNDDENVRQIGIRGDCVFGVYSTPHKSDIDNVFTLACTIVSFQKMFKEILYNYSMETFDVGIGLGCDKTLIVKTGKKGTGIRDFVWIGDSVVDASKLSSEANRKGKPRILMDEVFYENIKDMKANDNEKNGDMISEAWSDKLQEKVYGSGACIFSFDGWLNEGMK